MKELRILYIEDDKENRNDLVEYLSEDVIDDCMIKIDGEESFEKGLEKVNEYHIVILDLYKGVAGNGGETSGLTVLNEIREKVFIPVIFYSGNTALVKKYESQVIGVVTKGEDGIEVLRKEISRFIKHNLPYLRENIHNHIEKEFKRYFWEVIQEKNDIFKPENNDFSLGYLLLRNIGNSLSKENIANIIEDSSINKDKVHPMEFYIYPISNGEYENGEIVRNKSSKEVYVILTPSCDMVERFKGDVSLGRKAKKILLAKSHLLLQLKEYEDYKNKQSKENRNKLIEFLISKNDRYFFLPNTPFIDNRIIDFQDKIMVDYKSLNGDYERVAKLDSPFAQSMMASFIRYYNRIGFPDLDVEYVLNNL